MYLRPNTPKPVLLLACLCLLLATGHAWALSTDKNQNIDIHADHADFKADPKNTSNGTGIYTGHVVITQGSIVLHADKAVLHVVNNDLSSADMTGNPATFQQQPDVGDMMYGSAQEITYDASASEIVLITAARLSQAVERHPANRSPVTPAPAASTEVVNPPGERLMTADVIHYDTSSQHVIAKSGDESQRVHVSFPPKTPAPASTTAAAPAKSRKNMSVPPAGTRAPTHLGAPRHAPAPASTASPAAATHPAPAA